MIPISVPDSTPFRTGPFQLSMALVPLDLHDWIEPDDRLAQDLYAKERLLDERHDEVFTALPGAAEAAAEVLELLAEHLPRRFPALYRRTGDVLENLLSGHRWPLVANPLHPLDLAGRMVQEDLCLMQRHAETATYHLVGASVCFPTRWRLADKMGQSVAAIHTPVPGYEAQLATPMDRLFLGLKTTRPVWRVNWSLMDNPALFQPGGHGRGTHNPMITAHNAGDKLWLRMERQTLRRLPRTGAIVFTIRIHQQPLHTLTAHPGRAAAFAAAIRAMPMEMQRYKSLPPFLEAVLTWLDRVAATSR